MFEALDYFVRPRLPLRMVKAGCNALVQDLVDQGTLARAGNPCHQGQGSQGDFHIQILEIVFSCPQDLDEIPVALAPLRRNGDIFRAAQVLPRDGLRHLHDLLRGPHGHDPAAMGTGTRPDIDDMVRRIHRVLVMLHHDERIPQVSQMLERRQEAVVVPLMQPDARLVQDIEHSHKPGADLRGKTDALCLTARKRARCP